MPEKQAGPQMDQGDKREKVEEQGDEDRNQGAILVPGRGNHEQV